MSPEQLLPGQILPGQMSSWQLESVLDVPWNIALIFCQNRVSYTWDITNIEFVCVGGDCKVIFESNRTKNILGQNNICVKIPTITITTTKTKTKQHYWALTQLNPGCCCYCCYLCCFCWCCCYWWGSHFCSCCCYCFVFSINDYWTLLLSLCVGECNVISSQTQLPFGWDCFESVLRFWQLNRTNIFI